MLRLAAGRLALVACCAKGTEWYKEHATMAVGAMDEFRRDHLMTRRNVTMAAGVMLVVAVGMQGAGRAEPPAPVPVPAQVPVAPGAPGPAAGPAPITAEGLLKLVGALPTKRSPGPTAEHRAGLVAAEEWAIKEIRARGYEPVTHAIFSKMRPGEEGKGEKDGAGPMPATEGARWRNITFDLPGRSEEKAEAGSADIAKEVVLVSAHIDAVPTSPGADDDGTGVAAVLEIARVLKDVPLKRRVRFALFNLEESGLVGSTQYAQQAIEGGDKIVFMVSLEMLGYYRAEPASQKNPFPAFKGLGIPTVGDFIGLGTVLRFREVTRTFAAGMTATEPACKVFVLDHSPIAPPDLLRSDHAPFLMRGVPAVMCTDTADFRNPHYHKETDRVETLDGPRFAATVRGLVGGVRAVAGER
ncbi:MAG: M28 family peptidase [Phycisphaerales bacterium]